MANRSLEVVIQFNMFTETWERSKGFKGSGKFGLLFFFCSLSGKNVDIIS